MYVKHPICVKVIVCLWCCFSLCPLGVSTASIMSHHDHNMFSCVTNQIVFVTCAEYYTCRPYSGILTYTPLTNNL